MTSRIAQLQAALVTYLSKHKAEIADASIASTAQSLAVQGLEELNKKRAHHTGENTVDFESSNNAFFSFFDASYQYLTKVHWVLEVKSTYGHQIYKEYLNQELIRVTQFLKFHLQYTQQLLEDPFKMTIGNASTLSAPITNGSVSDIGSTQHHRMATNTPYLKANIDYQLFLESEIKKFETPSHPRKANVYEFTGSQADAMEIIEGLTEMKMVKINGEFANLGQNAEMWANWFGKPIPNPYSKKRINQSRKKEKAPFITKMAEVLRKAADRPKHKRA